MNISEMINRLEELKEEYGDLPVLIGTRVGFKQTSFIIDAVACATFTDQDVIAISSSTLSEIVHE